MKITTITLLIGSAALLAFLSTNQFLPGPEVRIGILNPVQAADRESARKMMREAEEAERVLQRQRRANLQVDLTGLNRKFEAAQQADAAHCQKRVREITSRAKQRFPGLAREAAAPMQGYGNAFYLVRLGTEDAIRSTRRRDDFVAKAMSNLAKELAKTQTELIAVVGNFESATRARINRHQAATLQLAELHEVPLAELKMPDFTGVERDLSALFGNLRNITIATSIEAIMIVPTIAVIKRVLAHVTGRAVTTATAAGVAAVADGPLPIGDAIGAVLAVGGGAWIAWDVRKAAKEMEALPGKIQKDMSAQINRWESESLKAAAEINRTSIERGRPVLP